MSQTNPTDEAEYLASVTLLLLGDDLEPDLVTRLLGLTPSRSWRRGEQRKFTNPNNGKILLFEDVYEWGGWKLFLEEEQKELTLEEQLDYWCHLLLPKTAALRELQSHDIWIRFSCFITTDRTASIRVTSTLQRKIAKLKVDLDFSFFAPHDVPQNLPE